MGTDKSVNQRYDAFDSLRAYACTLIVLSHCGIWAQGGLGNNIFFTLSGFFAVFPFIPNPEKRLLSLKGLFKYYLSKLLRIFPPLWISLLFSKYVLHTPLIEPSNFSTERSLLLNMLLINPLGHLWFLQQVVVFITVAPIFIYLAVLIKFIFKRITKSPRTGELAVSIVFLILTAILCIYPDIIPIHCRSNGGTTQFFLPRFLIGTGCAYLYRYFDYSYITSKKRSESFDRIKPRTNIICSVTLLAFLAFCILSSRDFLQYINPDLHDYLIGWKNPMLVCSATFIVIFALIFGIDSGFVRLFSAKFLAYIGKISFSIYIIHYFLIVRFPGYTPVKTFAIAYILSVIYAILMDKLIETPIGKLRRR